MTLLEMSVSYADSASALRLRMAELTAHYYDRSYHKHEKYTL